MTTPRDLMDAEDRAADERGVHRPYCFTELGGSCNCGFNRRRGGGADFQEAKAPTTDRKSVV